MIEFRAVSTAYIPELYMREMERVTDRMGLTVFDYMKAVIARDLMERGFISEKDVRAAEHATMRLLGEQ